MQVRIKDIMIEKGVSSVSLADMIGVSKVTVSNLINNKTMPSVETLDKIATALDIPMWQLFASKEEIQGEPAAPNTITCPKCGTRFKMEE